MARLVALLVLVAVAAYDSADDTVWIRVANASAVGFPSVVVNGEDFGAVEAGGASDYRAFGVAYRYGSVTVVAEGETYHIVPIDYVGETPLADGRYTYRLTLREGRLDQELVED